MAAARRDERFTPHLHCTVLAQQLFRLPRLVGVACDEDAKVPTREAGVVPRRGAEARDSRIDEHAGNGGECADEHHHFESDDGVGNPRGDRLATDHEGPVSGRPDGDPVSEADTEEAADQGEPANDALRGVDRVLEFVADGRRIDRDLAKLLLLEILDGRNRRVDLMECSDDTLHQ
jgi:hypothetical protein